MAFVIGAVGAVLVMGVFALGVFAGWKAHGRFAHVEPVKSASEQELKELAEQQEAFRQLQNYSAETAYGITGREGKV